MATKEVALQYPGGQAINLKKLVRLSTAVCLFKRDVFGKGTGIYVMFNSKKCILTCNHVMDTRSGLIKLIFNFDDEEDEPDEVDLKFGRFFHTDETLDFTLMEVSKETADKIAMVGVKPLLMRHPKPGNGITDQASICVIGYPKTLSKHFSTQRICYVSDALIGYWADTYPGSSGSAVFLNGQLVALHQQGHKIKNRNEGVTISAIIRCIQGEPVPKHETVTQHSTLHAGSVFAAPPENLENSWSCSACTYLNKSSSIRCKMCRTQKLHQKHEMKAVRMPIQPAGGEEKHPLADGVVENKKDSREPAKVEASDLICSSCYQEGGTKSYDILYSCSNTHCIALLHEGRCWEKFHDGLPGVHRMKDWRKLINRPEFTEQAVVLWKKLKTSTWEMLDYAYGPAGRLYDQVVLFMAHEIDTRAFLSEVAKFTPFFVVSTGAIVAGSIGGVTLGFLIGGPVGAVILSILGGLAAGASGMVGSVFIGRLIAKICPSKDEKERRKLMKETFEVFGLDKDTCEIEDIKKRFRVLSLKHHPDRPGGSTEAFIHLTVLKLIFEGYVNKREGRPAPRPDDPKRIIL